MASGERSFVAGKGDVSEAPANRRLGGALRYVIGAGVGVLALSAVLAGSPWYQWLPVFCVAVVIVVSGRGRPLRPRIARSGDEIVCRYSPLYEGVTYIAGLLLPAFGAASLGAGFADHNPPFVIGGVVIFAGAALTMFFVLLMWRRCVLYINPTTLRVRAAVIGKDAHGLAEIRRDHVQTIQPRRVPRTFGFQVEITYRTAGATAATKTVRLGPQAAQVTVEPVNLLNALTAWKEGAHTDPSQQMDRVEHALRERAT
ncbi:hypothetical protein MKCMC460_15530 [Mycobacterium sp. 20KCMC460]|uniref:hypothetical protein n=1 Tax=Mycobacterium sp. 20KCMC460 TaxID=2903536 RepID=UPI001EE19980|nr:hypothetical protein [Mycobacterium sp. 20KCMC460]BDE12693.1 hypothetical protein MKCMC460_15530 [Mycobacterium sp. 20KCMC460]